MSDSKSSTEATEKTMTEQQAEQTAELKGAALKTLGPMGVLVVGLLAWVQTGIADLRAQLVPRDVFDAKIESIVDSQRDLKLEVQLLGQRIQNVEGDISYFRGVAEAKDDE